MAPDSPAVESAQDVIILPPEHVHRESRAMVVSAIRERATDADNACAEFVEDWLPGWERACSAN